MDPNLPKAQSQSTGLIIPTNMLFIIMKLSGVVDWSWWHVMSPCLLVSALYIIAFIINATTSWFVGFQLPVVGVVFIKKMSKEDMKGYVEKLLKKHNEDKDDTTKS